MLFHSKTGKTRKISALLVILAMLSMTLVIGCSSNDNSNVSPESNASSNADSQEGNGTSPGNSSTQTYVSPSDIGRDTMPDSYTPGKIEGKTYINSALGIKYTVPGNFTITTDNSMPNRELMAVDDSNQMHIVIAYATDGVLDDFILASYKHFKEQESPKYNYHADIVDADIAGETRKVLTTEMTVNGAKSCSAITYFETDGHIVAVTATTTDVYASIGLLALTESLA